MMVFHVLFQYLQSPLNHNFSFLAFSLCKHEKHLVLLFFYLRFFFFFYIYYTISQKIHAYVILNFCFIYALFSSKILFLIKRKPESESNLIIFKYSHRQALSLCICECILIHMIEFVIAFKILFELIIHAFYRFLVCILCIIISII